MFIIAKTTKGKEYLYDIQQAIACKSKNQAETMAKHLTENNATAIGEFKLNAGEIWFAYEIDKYSNQPRYKFKTTKEKISITLI